MDTNEPDNLVSVYFWTQQLFYSMVYITFKDTHYPSFIKYNGDLNWLWGERGEGRVPITKHVTLQWLVTRKNIFVGFPSSVQDFFCLFFCTFNARVSGYLDLKWSICPFLAKVFQNKKNNYIRKKSLYRFIIRVLRDCQQCKICISRDILGVKLKNVGIFFLQLF